jgi:hypothetical protein
VSNFCLVEERRLLPNFQFLADVHLVNERLNLIVFFPPFCHDVLALKVPFVVHLSNLCHLHPFLY